MTAPTTTSAAQDYLREVEAELADLPDEERAELLEDLAMHLAALEEEGDERPLATRIGASADYAAELRQAAGLPPRDAAGTRRRDAWTRWSRQLRASAPARGLIDVLAQLRPAWWVVRGYLVVLLPSLRNVNDTRDFPLPAVLGSHPVGLLAIMAAVVLSVALGRRRLPRLASVVVIVVNLLLVVTATQVLRTETGRLQSTRIVAVREPGPPAGQHLFSRHGPVTDIFPYAADGTPLQGVLLFDQDGRPLLSGGQKWWADGCRRILTPPPAADGVPVRFSYPQPYLLDPAGTTLDGAPVGPGQCKTLTRPPVPLPVFGKTAPT